MNRYGFRRTSDESWAQSDLLYKTYLQQESIRARLFDFNRLDNR